MLDWHTRLHTLSGVEQHARRGRCLRTRIIHSAPYIFDFDQGSQFISQFFEQTALNAGCQISNDGRG
ncbi:hypothetical protein [Hymenobacter psychrophilus]|uniref:hypothetical protein n=1 Tax=Hymenobacter psychrophilus TaxID=651662 RepID=UPI001114AB8B|nr:hypothetical protein [Hymenobacter psychrophilus]